MRLFRPRAVAKKLFTSMFLYGVANSVGIVYPVKGNDNVNDENFKDESSKGGALGLSLGLLGGLVLYSCIACYIARDCDRNVRRVEERTDRDIELQMIADNHLRMGG